MFFLDRSTLKIGRATVLFSKREFDEDMKKEEEKSDEASPRMKKKKDEVKNKHKRPSKQQKVIEPE